MISSIPSMTKAKPKAYSYVRFSTPEQRLGDSQRRQTEAAQKYAREHGLELDCTLNLFDAGVSAFRGNNLTPDAALGRFKRFVEEGMVAKGSYLLIENLDRFSRQMAKKANRALEDLIDLGITVVTLQDGREYSQKTQEADPFLLIYAILGFIRAHDESETKGRRLRQAWANKRKQAYEKGIVATKRLPAWLKVDDNRIVEVIPERADIIQRIVKQTIKGDGRGKIAKDLNKEKIKPWGDGQGAARKAKVWHPTYIAKILRNPATYGLYTPHTLEIDPETEKERRVPQAPIEGFFPAVIKKHVFQEVQRLLENRDTRRGTHAYRGVSSIFAGLARCPKCNGTMTRVNKGPRGGTPFLVCVKAKVGAGCSYRSVNCQSASEALINRIPECLADFPGPDQAANQRIKYLDFCISEREGSLRVMVDGYARKPSSIIREKIDVEEVELNKDKEELRKLIAERDTVVGPWLDNNVTKLKKEVSKINPDHQTINLLLRSLSKGITIDYLNGYLEITWKHGGTSSIVFGFPKEE